MDILKDSQKNANKTPWHGVTLEYKGNPFSALPSIYNLEWKAKKPNNTVNVKTSIKDTNIQV